MKNTKILLIFILLALLFPLVRYLDTREERENKRRLDKEHREQVIQDSIRSAEKNKRIEEFRQIEAYQFLFDNVNSAIEDIAQYENVKLYKWYQDKMRVISEEESSISTFVKDLVKMVCNGGMVNDSLGLDFTKKMTKSEKRLFLKELEKKIIKTH